MPAEAAPSFLFVPELAERDTILELPPEERRYLFRVCRARDGEAATATDGRGGLARLVVEGEGREARVRVIEIRREDRADECWICCGAPEGTRADWLVEKLAELGATRFQPIDTERGRWTGGRARNRRWERLATAALRQSRQTWRMEIAESMSLEALDRAAPAEGRILADGAGQGVVGRPEEARVLRAVAIGPAGGFTPRERDQLVKARWRPVRLAGAVLRTETAALVAAGLWSAGRG